MSNTEPRVKRSTRDPVRSTRRPIVEEQPKAPRKLRRVIPAAMLAVLGTGLLGYQPVMNHVVGPAQLESVQASAAELTPVEIQENIERVKATPEMANDKELFDPSSIESIDALSAKPVLDTDTVVGAIYAPTVNLNMPILYGLSQDVLYSGAGTMKKKQIMGEGNYALLGHNSKNPNALFAPTHRLKVGDPVHVTDKNVLYTYTVTETKVVNPSEIQVIDDVMDTKLLTLISCTDDSKQRVVVHAELTTETPYDDADASIIQAFEKEK